MESEKNIEGLADKSKSACIKDGMMSFSMMGIGESYVVPASIALGASGPIVLLSSTLPRFCGCIMQIITSKFSCSLPSKKHFVLLGVSLQAFVWILLSLLMYFAFGWEYAVLSLFVLFCFHFFLGFSSSPAWAAWVSEFISEKERGSFFAKRNRIGIFFMVGTMLLGAFILEQLGTQKSLGFAILFLIAGICRLISSKFIMQMHEPTSQSNCVCGHSQIFDFLKDKKFVDEKIFLFYVFALMVATYVAAPIFDLYMLTQLGFSYTVWSIIKFAGIVSKPLFLPYWGNIMDTYGIRPVLYACGLLIPIVPFFWMFTTDPILLFFIEIISGIAWGGFELAALGVTMCFVDSQQRAVMTSAYNTFHGVGLFVGSLISAVLFAIWPIQELSAFMGLLLLSTIFRVLANVSLLSKIAGRKFSAIPASEILWQVMLLRPTRELRAVVSYCVHASESSLHGAKKLIKIKRTGL